MAARAHHSGHAANCHRRLRYGTLISIVSHKTVANTLQQIATVRTNSARYGALFLMATGMYSSVPAILVSSIRASQLLHLLQAISRSIAPIDV